MSFTAAAWESAMALVVNVAKYPYGSWNVPLSDHTMAEDFPPLNWG